jgi:hypothetical protein
MSVTLFSSRSSPASRSEIDLLSSPSTICAIDPKADRESVNELPPPCTVLNPKAVESNGFLCGISAGADWANGLFLFRPIPALPPPPPPGLLLLLIPPVVWAPKSLVCTRRNSC